MQKLGVISKVDILTDWCAGVVVVPKPDGRICICVDLTKLNESVLRETYPLPKIDNLLVQISESKFFSKLDCNSGFWQEKFNPDSRLLTTFITPFGRFCFNRMPLGIKSAPEHYQKKMSQILEGSRLFSSYVSCLKWPLNGKLKLANSLVLVFHKLSI